MRFFHRIKSIPFNTKFAALILIIMSMQLIAIEGFFCVMAQGGADDGNAYCLFSACLLFFQGGMGSFGLLGALLFYSVVS